MRERRYSAYLDVLPVANGLVDSIRSTEEHEAWLKEAQERQASIQAELDAIEPSDVAAIERLRAKNEQFGQEVEENRRGLAGELARNHELTENIIEKFVAFDLLGPAKVLRASDEILKAKEQGAAVMRKRVRQLEASMRSALSIRM